MPEQATPDTGASQELSPQQRMENLLMQPQGQAGEEEDPNAGASPDQSQESGEQPDGQADTDTDPEGQTGEVEVTQPEVEFEIVHNGQQVKLSREELIKNAQQGFDYTRKTEVLAQQARDVQETLQRLAEVEQVQPYLMQQRAQVESLASQLAQYQRVDWVAVANEDPMAYPAKRAAYDQLKESYWAARQQYDQASSAVKQQLTAVQEKLLAAEVARIPDLIPEWRDTDKRSAGIEEMARHYKSLGVERHALDSKLTDAFSMSVAFKAMKWDQLQKTKDSGVKQLRQAPPMTRPGASQSSSAKADKDKALRQTLKKSGSATDAMAVLLNRMK